MKTEEMKTKERNEIVENNMGLVYVVATKYSKFNVALDIEDLTQVGCLGLINAAEKFDSTRECKFSTYAYHCISGYLENWLAKQRLIDIPKLKFVNVKKLSYCENRLTSKLGRKPSASEIAEDMDITLGKCTSLIDIRRKMSYGSLDEKNSTDCNASLALQVADPMNEYDNLIDNMALKESMKSLKTLERNFIEMKFLKSYTVQDIASATDYSRQSVNQTINKGLAKMKRYLYN